MRQLKLYTWNDAKPQYKTNVDPIDGSIEATWNTEKYGPERYFQYVSKDIFMHPNNKIQKGIESVDKMKKTKGGRLMGEIILGTLLILWIMGSIGGV